ncbi:MAG: hypothetical protein EXS38_02510 [Opitutus sp.]|nr:hypothetical protein [Opitutus sp.]
MKCQSAAGCAAASPARRSFPVPPAARRIRGLGLITLGFSAGLTSTRAADAIDARELFVTHCAP